MLESGAWNWLWLRGLLHIGKLAANLLFKAEFCWLRADFLDKWLDFVIWNSVIYLLFSIDLVLKPSLSNHISLSFRLTCISWLYAAWIWNDIRFDLRQIKVFRYTRFIDFALVSDLKNNISWKPLFDLALL